MNVCGFDGDQSTLKYVEIIAEKMGAFIPSFKGVLEPVTPNWIYSLVINPMGLRKDEMILAGEVELYIFERIYESWKFLNKL